MNYPALGETVDEVMVNWSRLRPRLNCQRVVGRIVSGGGTYEYREGVLYRVFDPCPSTMSSTRVAKVEEVAEVEEAARFGWLQVVDEPNTGIQYGNQKFGVGCLVLHQATGNQLSIEQVHLDPDVALAPFDEARVPEVKDERATIRRDAEYVRMAQQRYVEGYEARLAMLHPMRRNGSGKEMQQRESKWSYADRAESACPGIRKVEGACVILSDPWPKHERERWSAGFLAADLLCVENGLAHATSRHPKHVPRKKPVALAEPLDAFPDTEMTKTEAKAFWDRHRGVYHAPTTADEQE